MAASTGIKLAQFSAIGLSGIVLGAAGMSVLHAQTATAPAYVVGNIQEVTDPELFKQYQAKVSGIGAKYGERMLVRGATPQLLDAPLSTQPKGTIVIIQFPSMQNLKAWWNSPEYAAARPLREKSTVGQMYVVEGLPAP